MHTPLEAGMMIDGDELLMPLKPPYRQMPTWKVRAPDGQINVLRIIAAYSLRDVPKRSLEPMMSLPPIRGFVPWTDWKFVELNDTKPPRKVLIVRRPFYAERLLDRFPADAENPPSAALLDAFNQLAETFDTLQAHLPELDFDLSPGNLLLDGHSPLLVDIGLARYVHFSDMDARAPIHSHCEPERQTPLSASYPSMWLMWFSTRSAQAFKIERTDAQYSLGALYVYLRTRLQVFEDPAVSFPHDASVPNQERFMMAMRWSEALTSAIRAYEEKGTLKLAMLTDERERAVVARALARDAGSRYADCRAFVEALCELR